MCEICKDVVTKEDLYSPSDWLKCLNYIKELLRSGNYEFTEATCNIDEVKSGGCWVDDIIKHTIECKKCCQKFTCIADTYHGRASFKKR